MVAHDVLEHRLLFLRTGAKSLVSQISTLGDSHDGFKSGTREAHYYPTKKKKMAAERLTATRDICSEKMIFDTISVYWETSRFFCYDFRNVI